MERLEREITLLEEKLRNPKHSIEEKVDTLLKALEIKSYDYNDCLKEAVCLCLNDRTYLGDITKKLYPKIARKKFICEKQVRNDIKTVLDKLYEENSNIIKQLRIYVIGDILGTKNKFSNIDLINSLVNYINDLEMQDEREVSNILKKLAFKPGEGYNYLREAIIITLNKEGNEKLKRKTLYEQIALKYNVKPHAVEGCMRWLIRNFFNAKCPECILENRQRVFGNNVTEVKLMSNTQVINHLAKYIVDVA